MAEDVLGLPGELAAHLASSGRAYDDARGHAPEWPMEGLREPAQPIVDRIDELTWAGTDGRGDAPPAASRNLPVRKAHAAVAPPLGQQALAR